MTSELSNSEILSPKLEIPKQEDNFLPLFPSEKIIVRENTQNTFAQFLRTRATNGFSTQDHLKYRHVEYVTAEGLWNKLKAFVNLGGLGYFFSENIDDNNRETLRKECEFYRQFSAVQHLYQKFSKNPDSANFKGLKDAYENILKLAENNDGSQHTIINVILDKGLGKDMHMGAAILERIATNGFNKDNSFNEDNILNTITGTPFLKEVKAKWAQGYRGATFSNEGRSWCDIESEIFKGLHAGEKDILMSSARAYVKLCDENDEKEKNAYDLSLKLKTKFPRGDILPSEIDTKINDYNAGILRMMDGPSINDSAVFLPFGCNAKQLGEMQKLYKEYKEGLGVTTELRNVGQASKEAEKTYEAEKNKTKTYTLDEFKAISGENPDNTLPGVSDYLKLKGDIEFFETNLESDNKKITERRTEILKKISSAENSVKHSDWELKEKERSLMVAAADLIEFAKHRDSITKPSGIGGFLEKESISLTREVSNLRGKIALKKKEIEDLEKEFELLKEELPYPFRYLQASKGKHSFVEQRERTQERLQEAKKQTISLNYKDIQTLSKSGFGKAEGFEEISNNLDDLNQKLNDYQTKENNLNQQILQTQENMEKGKNLLKNYGFKFGPDNLASGIEFAGFDSEYRKKLAEHLKREKTVTAEIIRVMEMMAMRNEDLNRNRNIAATYQPIQIYKPSNGKEEK